MKNKHFLDDNKHLILDKLFSLNDFKCRIYIHYHALISRNQCSVKLIKKQKRLLTHSHVFISVYMWWGCLHFIWGDVCFDEFNFVLGILVSACEWWKSWSEKLGKYCTSHHDFESLLNNLNFILLIWYSFLNCIIKTILYLIMFDSSINFKYESITGILYLCYVLCTDTEYFVFLASVSWTVYYSALATPNLWWSIFWGMTSLLIKTPPLAPWRASLSQVCLETTYHLFL